MSDSSSSAGSHNRFAGKVVVITGGNSGIGRASAEAFVREGAKVVVFGRDKKTIDDTVGALGDSGLGVQGDVTRLEDLERLFATTKERFGQVDVLFANAGIAKARPLADVDEAFFDQTFGINVKGLFFTVQKALPVLNDGASVVLTGSVADRMGLPGLAVYSATKGAVRTLARGLSAELGERGIRVNTISPGPIETPIFGKMELSEEAVEEMGGQILERVPANRMGTADEVAAGVLFLASSESAYVIGGDLAVDGGTVQL